MRKGRQYRQECGDDDGNDDDDDVYKNICTKQRLQDCDFRPIIAGLFEIQQYVVKPISFQPEIEYDWWMRNAYLHQQLCYLLHLIQFANRINLCVLKRIKTNMQCRLHLQMRHRRVSQSQQQPTGFSKCNKLISFDFDHSEVEFNASSNTILFFPKICCLSMNSRYGEERGEMCLTISDKCYVRKFVSFAENDCAQNNSTFFLVNCMF